MTALETREPLPLLAGEKLKGWVTVVRGGGRDRQGD